MAIPVIDPQKVDPSAQRLIDVRSLEEFHGELGHVPGSELIEMGPDLEQALSELDKNTNLVFICRSGNRSGTVTAYAVENGFTQVFNMNGGMLLWNELGLEVTR